MSTPLQSVRRRTNAATANWRPLFVELSLVTIVFAAIVTAAMVGLDAGRSSSSGTQDGLGLNAGVFLAAGERLPAN